VNLLFKMSVPIKRRETIPIILGNLQIGGGAPVSVQSMTKTLTQDIPSTLKQIESLIRVRCQVIRLAVPDEEAVSALATYVEASSVPLVADIHFDYRLALASLEAGVHGLRINPGNIGAKWKVREVVKAASERGVPVRIGVNSGSLEKDILKRYGGPTPEAMVESALRHVEILEELGFHQIKISLKASSVPETVKAYGLISQKVDYPLHIGITEAGADMPGTVFSSVGLGILLWQGIGDTLRVSLTGPPEDEVLVGYEILRSLGLYEKGVRVISCPTPNNTYIILLRSTYEKDSNASSTVSYTSNNV
jgi:(E)-4-hydroxy-3-methylbut-2-enyl-diphosphate synthase